MKDDESKGRLVIDRRVGQSFFVGKDVEIKIDSVREQSYVRVSIVAPKSVSIIRSEKLDNQGK
jgi:carbon storage regulator CsrA